MQTSEDNFRGEKGTIEIFLDAVSKQKNPLK